MINVEIYEDYRTRGLAASPPFVTSISGGVDSDPRFLPDHPNGTYRPEDDPKVQAGVPDQTVQITNVFAFELPSTSAGEAYRYIRFSGVLTFPENGATKLSVVGDNQARLYLAPDDDLSNIPSTVTLDTKDWTANDDFEKRPEQWTTLNVSAGERRAFKIDSLIGSPGSPDNFGIGWQLPSQSAYVHVPLSAINNAPPVISGTPPSGTVGEAYDFDLTTSDPDGDVLTVSIKSGTLPAGLTLSGNKISGAPTASGSSTVVFQVADGNGGFAEHTVTIPIADPNQDPLISGAADDGEVGIEFGFSLQTSDPDSDPVTVMIKSGSLPAGVELNGTEIAGVPEESGEFTIVFEALDGRGGSAEHSVTFVIHEQQVPQKSEKLASVRLYSKYCRGAKSTGESRGVSSVVCLPEAEAHRLVKRAMAEYTGFPCGLRDYSDGHGCEGIQPEGEPKKQKGSIVGSESVLASWGQVQEFSQVPPESDYAEISFDVSGSPAAVRFTSGGEPPSVYSNRGMKAKGAAYIDGNVSAYKFTPECVEHVVIHATYYKTNEG